MTSQLNIENRMDQLSALGILPWPKDGIIKIKFSKEFYNTFTRIWKDSLLKSKIKFDQRLQVVSGATLVSIHPELGGNDVFELSQVCLFIWHKFYKVNEKEYHSFLKFENKKIGLDAFL